MAGLRVAVVALVVALALPIDAEISNYRGSDLDGGARCWGPGVWPHPRHCRLFSVCRLQDHEVIGHLVACPEGTGFSSRHLRCVAAETVAGCRDAPPPGALRSVLVLSSNTTRRHQCSYDGVSYCESDATLVVCAPNQRLLGRVDCNDQQRPGSVDGRCDEHDDATCLFSAHVHSDLLALEDKSMGFELDAAVHNASLAEPTTASPVLESVSLISPEAVCQRVGLHCLDARTLGDCDAEDSAPVFSISCAEVMTSDRRDASGRCVAGACQLALDGVRLNLELATLDFGDEDTADRMSDLLDEEDEGLPEMMDAELLRGTPSSGWGWFRNSGEDDVAVNETLPEKPKHAFIDSKSTGQDGGASWWRTQQVAKVPRVVRVPSENATVAARFAERCARGGLVCLDSATLVACSGDDVDTPTYAILCAGQAKGGNVTLTAHCDLESDSCQLESE